MSDPEEKSILKGVNDLIDSELGLMDIGETPHHRHGTSCDRLAKSPMTGIALDLIAKIYEEVESNWVSIYHKKSKQNWRFEKNTRIDRDNGPEVRLERAIVNIPDEIWPDDAKCWVNQVPVASGLVDPHADGSRKIDLVHKCGSDAYEFIELKIDSDTPLYAAMEILKYGVLYIFCRQDERVSPFIHIHEKENLLQAKKIHLKVLAPAKYYEKYDRSWLETLETSINNGLAKFLAQPKFAFELEMDFKFETLSLILSRSPVTRKASA
jgi:hypothetical protein